MKYIIDVPEDRIKDGKLNLYAEVESLLPTRIQTGIKCKPYTEPDRKAIEDKVWEFVGKIQKMTCEQMHKVLGIIAPNYDDFCNEISYQDAKAKYEEWREQKYEIHEYDEIISEVPDNKAVIVRIDCWGQWHCINADGSFMVEINQQGYWRKTGRSFPELGDVIKKMGEE